jgi:hypothetical protein
MDKGGRVNELLELAVKAHGGTARWNQLKTITANMSITGGIWYLKGRPDVLKDVVVEASLHEERVVTHYRNQNRRTIFTPGEILSESEQGELFERRTNPRASFEGHTAETPWDNIHVAYFQSEALWTYLTTPFLYTYPEFIAEELAPWQENGEIWRSLKVTFPNSVTSHTREQISYFGPDGLLRRHEYTVDILGGATGLNYAADYKEFDGIMVPTTRRIFPYDAKKQKVSNPLLVAIDISEVFFT